MDTVYRCCAGVDVHLRTCEVCVRRVGPDGKAHSVTRQFRTTTRAILEMAEWLEERGVEMVAMESTGVYWKPLWNLLEGRVNLMLCNARHVRNVPGRKTDKRDAQWLADLLQHGLLKPSFVPSRRQRFLRDLTRQRRVLADEKTRVVNRIQKVLEDANIKLSSVASDVMGASGRDMIRAIIAGERDPAVLADMARQKLRRKLPELREALCGDVTEHHRFMLQLHMEQIEFIEQKIAELQARIDDAMVEEAKIIERLEKVAGIQKIAAQAILAEIGTDMSRFPTAAHLCSWARLCPGTNESAGKRRRSGTGQGNRWLRAIMAQAAWGAAHTKNSYYSAQFRRLAGRRGKKRALMAVSHSLLVTIYHMLKNDTEYHDLGVDYFDRRQPEQLARSLVRRLEKLGLTVTVESRTEAA
jgi:transposase